MAGALFSLEIRVIDKKNELGGANKRTVKAYVLIEVQVGRTKDVVESLRGLEGVTSVDVVTGSYDAIAILERKTLNDVGELVTAKIHPVNGISRTVTCFVV